MKTVIKEYAGAVMALLSTCLFFRVMGGLLFHWNGAFSQIVEAVLEGGV